MNLKLALGALVMAASTASAQAGTPPPPNHQFPPPHKHWTAKRVIDYDDHDYQGGTGNLIVDRSRRIGYLAAWSRVPSAFRNPMVRPRPSKQDVASRKGK